MRTALICSKWLKSGNSSFIVHASSWDFSSSTSYINKIALFVQLHMIIYVKLTKNLHDSTKIPQSAVVVAR